MSIGILYIVATPIGNLGDMSMRAMEILSGVDLIAAEDTRHSARLLQHYGIKTPCRALHEYNERNVRVTLVKQLLAGASVALISDAGTPLISDPGYPLVSAARAKGIVVVPIPGPCALIAALSASGLPSDRFVFEGFLPARQAARRARLEELCNDTRTLIFYESPHRIKDCLDDFMEVLGAERIGVIARELTKTFETIHSDTLQGLGTWLRSGVYRQKGEFVVLVHGNTGYNASIVDVEAQRILGILMKELPLKQAAALTARITGVKKNAVYQFAVEQSTSDSS